MTKSRFSEFVMLAKARLERGEEEYGDSSFDLPPEILIDEIQEELLDVTNWSFILWETLERCREKTERLTDKYPAVEPGIGNRTAGMTEQHKQIAVQYYNFENPVLYVCDWCGADIRESDPRIRSGQQWFCSSTCFVEFVGPTPEINEVDPGHNED